MGNWWDWVPAILDNVALGQCCWKVSMRVGMGEDYYLVPSLPIFMDTDYKFLQGGLGPGNPSHTREVTRGQEDRGSALK